MDDLTQDTFLRALGSLHRFEGRSSARTWLLAIARRAVADSHRYTAVRPRTADVSDWQLAVERAQPRGLPGFDDGIVLFERGDREVLDGASACIACGRCDTEAAIAGAFEALGPQGPMAFVLGVSRHSGEHDAAQITPAATDALLAQLTRICPVRVPFVPLTALVARRKQVLGRVRNPRDLVAMG